MNRRFYFLVASLPELGFDRPLPITPEAFLVVSSDHVPTEDLEFLAAIRLFERPSRATRSSALCEWLDREQALRNALAELRAQRVPWGGGREPPSGVFPDPELASLAVRILAADDPRRVEDELDRARWRILEDLEFGHYFDFEALTLYCLKLRLLERRAVFDKGRGRQRFLGFSRRSAEQASQACAQAPENVA